MEGEVDRVVGDELLIFGDGCTGEVSLGRRRRRFRVFLGGSKLVYGGGVSMLPERADTTCHLLQRRRRSLQSPLRSRSRPPICPQTRPSPRRRRDSSQSPGLWRPPWRREVLLPLKSFFPLCVVLRLLVDGVWKYFDFKDWQLFVLRKVII